MCLSICTHPSLRHNTITIRSKWISHLFSISRRYIMWLPTLPLPTQTTWLSNGIVGNAYEHVWNISRCLICRSCDVMLNPFILANITRDLTTKSTCIDTVECFVDLSMLFSLWSLLPESVNNFEMPVCLKGHT